MNSTKQETEMLRELQSAMHDMACIQLCLLQNDPSGALDLLRDYGRIKFTGDHAPTFESPAITAALAAAETTSSRPRAEKEGKHEAQS